MTSNATLVSGRDYGWHFEKPGKLAEFYAGFQLPDGRGLTEHPISKLPDAATVVKALRHRNGLEWLTTVLSARETAIKLMEDDPLHHGYEWPWYGDARWLLDGKGPGERPKFMEHFPNGCSELLVLGGNDSGKSWFAAKWSCEQLEKFPEIDFVFGHNTEDSSQDQQQRLVYRHFPPAWRTAGRSQFVDTSFKGKGGFTNNKFVVGQRRGLFLFYKQEMGRLTGYKLRGVWCDELVTMPFIEEMRTRLLGREGKLLVTFTPIEGYTVVVGLFLSGAEVIEWRPSRYLPGQNFPDIPVAPAGHMPYILKCRRSGVAVLCAFSEWSPFRKPTEVERLIEGKTKGFIKQRLYGWPEKGGGVILPKFGNVNIITPSKWAPNRFNPERPGLVPPHPWRDLYPRIPRPRTLVMFVDPGETKNWFIKWYAITKEPAHIFLYREWPDEQTCGEWALPGDKHDGVPGPAQRYEFGRSIEGYKKLILEAEGWKWDEENRLWIGKDVEPIMLRSMDARLGGAPVPSATDEAVKATGASSIIGMMGEEQRDRDGNIIGPSMPFVPSPGEGIKGGLQLLSSYFEYDTNRPVTILNCPKWYVVEHCRQSIYCYREYTGLDGDKGTLKDVIDPDRYLAKSDLHYIDPQEVGYQGGGPG